MQRLCFVCHGNICRSPTAAGVMRHLLKEAGAERDIVVDSAGTSAYHIGESPDRRAHAAAARRGVRLEGSARQFLAEDFDRFDYVLAMDAENRRDLSRLARNEADRRKIFLLRDFDPASGSGQSVPDPYYGGVSGFDEVLAQCDRACRGLLEHVLGGSTDTDS